MIHKLTAEKALQIESKVTIVFNASGIFMMLEILIHGLN